MDINDVLKEFKATQSGDYYILYCPQCGRKEAYCYIEDINHWLEDSSYRIPIRCNRLNKCGETSYLNDYLKDIKKTKNLKIKEKSNIQMTPQGVELLQTYCHYITFSVKGNTHHFNFDIRGISNDILKENGIIYNDKTFQHLINQEKTKHHFGNKYRGRNYLDRDIIIPIMNLEGYPERLLLRSTFHQDTNAKKKYKKEIQVMLIKKSLEIWNIKDAFDKEKNIIFVTEGVYDALSIKEVCQESEVGCIALPGVKKYKQLLRLIRNNPELKEKTFIFALDNDTAGKEYVLKIERDFAKENIEFMNFSVVPYKDCNQFLESHPKAMKFRIYKMIKKIQTCKIS